MRGINYFMNNREHWLDTAKGIGILAVVAGHSSNMLAHTYLFWFHMPLFFIISGYLYKNLDTMQALKSWVNKRTKQLLIPYVSFGLLISAIIYIQTFSIPQLLMNFKMLTFGGESLTSYFGVFWFITCLYLTQILFAYIQLKIKKLPLRLLIILIFYVIARIITTIPVLKGLIMPWNADVVFMAYVYYSIGFYGKDLIKKLIVKYSTLIISLVLALVLVLSEINGLLNFRLDMKHNGYSVVGFDILIPVIFVLCIFAISYQLSTIIKYNILGYLGAASLTIMYLHLATNILLQQLFSYSDIFTYTVIGILIPVIVHYFFLEKFNITRKLYLGVFKSKVLTGSASNNSGNNLN